MTKQIGIEWAVLALITGLAAYYVQIMNRLLDIKPDDRRRRAKYYRTRIWLSWMVVSLFIAVFTIALNLTPIYHSLVILAFLASQILHVFVFLQSYGWDLIGKAKTREGYWRDNGIYMQGRKVAVMMRLGHVLFWVGFGCLILSFVIFHVIRSTIRYPVMEATEYPYIGTLGHMMWIVWFIGIVLTGVGYWRKK